ncbi:hypothetical protein PAXRUDRAFT_825621 [Paxillus rubicundulus Ve08.2h10]|uniref:SCD domain-containing protein n=1 Tax=Paxillus rubicundulus Ve08.2h10 TaxID=930991 RepID=A0A0D0E5R9_9AGAM|nr:hypothetical protein PAXRUDRAFT_825621 [Paxillus rubicundulus Ve08.2h10]
MSNTQPERSPAPRRSQRDRKQVKPFASGSQSPNKRKRSSQADDDNELTELSELQDAQQEVNQEDGDADEEGDQDDQDFNTPKPKKSAPSRRKGKSSGPPPAKKPRTTKSAAPKPPKLPRQPKPRARKLKAADGDFDATKVATDTKIATDNTLFNAILNPSAALQSTAEDFLDSLSQSAGAAQAELINCILRACGCNDSVDADEVLDYDGVVDSLDNFTEGLKQENSPIYPLTSKLLAFKRFRASLSELIERLILAAAELGSLYTSDLITTLQTWVVAMSSSQIRSFRHTATVVALEVETALCQVAAAVEKEAEIVGRQREGERKRKAKNRPTGVREKDLDGKAAEVRKRRTALAEYLKEIVDGVFVHRYRDLDPNIRTECVRAMAAWFTHYPAHFLDASYLRYVGWVLSDSSTPVRLEAVRALAAVYAQSEYVGSLTHFTERFKPRLLEMAGGDTELSVRTAVIGVLGAIDGHALLEDEERERMCLLVFDAEARVRKAVGGFVGGVLQELAEERVAVLAGRNKNKAGEKVKARAGVKALAMLLVKWGKALDRASEASEEESVLSGEGGSGSGRRIHPPSVGGADPRGRIALAVEALWDEVEALSDWEGILDVLLLDHSAGGDEDMDGNDSLVESARSGVDPALRLSEVEESVLLEVLVASLRRAKAVSASGKKGEEETVVSDITRALIKGLPGLFIKYQTDEAHISDVLLIPPLMNLDLYLEMRMMNAYASFWDDVTKQLLSHSSQTVLTKAVSVIRHFMAATSLTNTNSTKILELEDELATQLRDAVAGREEIEVASFTEDEVLALGAVCARICALAGSRDICAWMEEDEGGKQSSAWDIVCALVERGRLGYKEEERMIEQGLHLLSLHIIWKARNLPDPNDTSPDSQNFRTTLQEQRDSLLEKLVEYVVGQQSNTAEGVRRTAFQNLMNLHILFCSSQATSLDGQALPTAPLALQLDEEVQHRCAGFIQATIEHYAELLEDGSAAQEVQNESDHDDSSEEEPTPAAKNPKGKGKSTSKAKAKSPAERSQPLSRPLLEQEYRFMATISTFLRAIRAGAVHVKHSDVLLSNHGRLGPAFDLCTKVIIDVLREEGMHNDNGEIVVEVIKKALLESFSLVMDSVVKDEERTINLAKQLASSFIIRGAQLAVVRKLDGKYIAKVHKDLLKEAIKNISTCEKSKNKKRLHTAVLFFKVLVPLLSAVESRDALAIKAQMDQLINDAKIEIKPTAKAWEPQRVYEKKLVAVMHKVAGGKGRKATAKGVKSAAVVTSDEESGAETEPQPDVAEESRPLPSHTRPKPRPASPAPTQSERDGAEGDAELTEAGVDDVQTTPRGRNGDASPQSPARTSMAPPLSTNGVTPPTSSRKRRRDEEDMDEDAELGTGADAHDDTPSEDVPPTEETSPAQISPTNEFIIRRKRARH